MLPQRIFKFSILLVKMGSPISSLWKCVHGHCSPSCHYQCYSACCCFLKVYAKKNEYRSETLVVNNHLWRLSFKLVVSTQIMSAKPMCVYALAMDHLPDGSMYNHIMDSQFVKGFFCSHTQIDISPNLVQLAQPQAFSIRTEKIMK